MKSIDAASMRAVILTRLVDSITGIVYDDIKHGNSVATDWVTRTDQIIDHIVTDAANATREQEP